MQSDAGIEATWNGVTRRVTATGPGELRVELFMAEDGAPERASWAVLPAFQSHEERVTPDGPSGFRTALLAVSLDPGTLALTVRDAAGRVLLADHARDPVRRDRPGFRLRKHVSAGTRFHGLGDKPDGLDKRGHAYAFWNSDQYGFGESWDPLYKTIPFLLAREEDGTTTGLFVDCTHRTGFDLAAAEPDVLAIAARASSLRYHVLAGPDPKAVIERFTRLVGRPRLPPLWALGYGQSRYSYESADRALAVIREHRRRRIPLDAIWLDIGFQDRNRPFTTDRTRYPDLAAFVDEARALGVRTVVIADLHVPVAPGENHASYEDGIAGDHFVRDASGERYVGTVWPGPCHFPDLTREATRAWWGTLAARFVADGVAGIWNDMNEPAVSDGPGKTMPLDVRHRISEPGFAERTATHDEIHNVYGMQNVRATHDGLLALRPDSRPYVMTRAAYAGAHRYAVTWTGDNTSTWNHLRLATPQLLGLGLGGFGLAGCDIGGFRGNPSPALLTQWIATGAFHPLFRNHTDFGSADQEAWAHGARHERRRRRAIRRRYRLMPYLYTAVEEMTRTGVPVMRPLFLDHPDPALASVDTSFLLGRSLLVAPPPDETLGPYDVALPAGTDWFVLETGEPVPVNADGVARFPRRNGTVPVLVRAGAIVPMARPVESLAHRRGALRLHVFPGADGEGHVYDDDGESLAHESGAFHRQRFRFADGVLSLEAPEGNRPPFWPRIRVMLHGVDEPLPVRDAAGSLIRARFDAARRVLRFHVPVAAGRVRVG